MQEVLSLLFGAAVIVFFARERFNIASFETEIRLQRLADLLAPDKMRAHTTVRLSFMLYLVLLLTLYLAICLYARFLPDNIKELIGATSEQVGATGLEGAPGTGTGITSSFPVWIALAIVGLGPSIPIVKNGEAWLRERTHQLVGIPTRVLNNAADLRRSEAANEILAGIEDKKETESGLTNNDILLLRQVKKQYIEIPDSEDLIRSLQLCAVISAWIFRGRADPGHSPQRRNFQELEKRLHGRKRELFKKLKGAINLDPKSDGSGQNGGSQGSKGDAPDIPRRDLWESLTRDARELADDIHLYLALLVEHRVLPTRRAVEKKTMTGRINAKLANYLADIRPEKKLLTSDHTLMVTLFWTFWIVLAMGVFQGAVWSWVELRLSYPTSPARWNVPLSSRTTRYTLTSLLSYVIPVMVAMALWYARDDRALQHQPQSNLHSHWTESLPKLMGPFFLGWLIACMTMSSLALFRSMIAGKNNIVDGSDFFERVNILMQYNAPISLRGACLALLLTVLVDRIYTDQHKTRQRSPLMEAIKNGMIMALIGGTCRWLVIYWSINRSTTTYPYMRPEDYGNIVHAAWQTGLLTALITFAVASALHFQIHKTKAVAAAADTKAIAAKAETVANKAEAVLGGK